MDLEEFVSKRQISSYEVDSRQVKENSLFFALRGEKTDGHLFLGDVAGKKAGAAIVSKHYLGENFGLPLFYSNDPLETLQELAAKKINKNKMIIAVTGSCGKTTTKEFIFQMLSKKYQIECSPKNQNSQVGLAISILNFKNSNPDLYVLEMGMSKKNEIAQLIKIAAPNIAVITKVGFAHAENFASQDEIFAAKAEIFAPKTEIAVLNYELLKYKNTIPSPKIFFFSNKDKNADYCIEQKNEIGHFYEKGKLLFEKKLPFGETHFVENLAAAFAICRILGMASSDIKERINGLLVPDMRYQKIEKRKAIFINDAYNANPEAMRAALENLPKTQGKKIAVLGAMKELGKFSNKLHAEIFQMAEEHADIVLCLGAEWQSVCPKGKLFLDHNSIALKLLEIVEAKDLVLIKGSRAMQMEKIFDLI